MKSSMLWLISILAIIARVANAGDSIPADWQEKVKYQNAFFGPDDSMPLDDTGYPTGLYLVSYSTPL